MKVACFSVATMDYYPQQEKYYAGGNSLNQAARFGQIGYDCAFVGAVGTDEAGEYITTMLKKVSVDISHIVRIPGKTATNQIINDDDGERFGVEGPWQGGVYDQFVLRASDWQFLEKFDVWSTHVDCPSYSEALKRKHEGQLMTVDFLHLTDYELLQKSFSVVDIAYFGGTVDMVDDLTRVAQANPHRVIVLTLGGNGSLAFAGDTLLSQPALPLEKVLDTTGCGDAFQAGFTASYFKTKDIHESLLAGAALGRLTAQHYGGTPDFNLHTGA